MRSSKQGYSAAGPRRAQKRIGDAFLRRLAEWQAENAPKAPPKPAKPKGR